MKRVLALLAVATLTACGGGGGGGGVAPPPVTPVASTPAIVAPVVMPPTIVATPPVAQVVSKQGCQTNIDPTRFYAWGSGYTALSNAWNTKVASAYSSCVDVVIDAVNNVSHAVFDWSATLISRVDVVAYPNIYVGWLLDIPNTTPALPLSVTSTKNIVATGKISTTCSSASCLYQNAFDIFFSNSATSNVRTHELEILTTYKWDWAETGTRAYTTVVDNIVYTVSTLPVTSPNTGESWTVILYVPATPIVDIKMNISHIISDAVAHGLIRSTEYTTMVGLGTEVMSGKGTTNLSNFRVKID